MSVLRVPSAILVIVLRRWATFHSMSLRILPSALRLCNLGPLVHLQGRQHGTLQPDAATLRGACPRLVYCSITGFGQTGPYVQRAGYDYAVQGMGGLMSVTGECDDMPRGGPQKVGVAVANLFTGMYAAVPILAALRHRDLSGQGQMVDMALMGYAMLAPSAPATLRPACRHSVWATRTGPSCRTRCLRWPTVTSSWRWGTTGSSRGFARPPAWGN